MNWFFLAIAAVLFVVIETIIEKRTLSKARSLEFAAMFAFSNALVLMPFLLVADISQINSWILFLIFLSAIPSAGAAFLVFKTIKHNQLSESAPILALLPLVVAVMAFWMLDEKITLVQLCGLLLMIGGMIFLEIKNFKLNDGIFRQGRGKYILYLILYLFIAGVSAIFDRLLLFDYKINSLTYLIFIQLFIALCYVFYYAFRPRAIKILQANIKDSWKIIFLISILTVSHRYMYVSAIQVATSMGLVVAVYKLSSLFHVFAGRKFFAEYGIIRKVIASIVILSGTILLVIK